MAEARMTFFFFFIIAAALLQAQSSGTLEGRFEFYRLKADERIANDFITAEKYMDSMFSIARRIKGPSKIFNQYYFLKASLARNRGMYIDALKYYLESYSLAAERYNEPGNDRKVIETETGHILSEIGSMFYWLKSYENAGFYYREAIERFTGGEDDFGMSLALNNLGLNYEKSGNLDSAEICYEQSLNFRKKINNGRDYFTLGHSRVYLGRIRALKKDYKRAMIYFMEADSLLRLVNTFHSVERQSENHYERALMYEQMGDKNNFDKYLEMAINLAGANGIYTLESYFNMELAGYYIKKNDVNPAAKYAARAWELAEKNNILKIKPELSKLLFHISTKKGNMSRAIYWSFVSDSLTNVFDRQILTMDIETATEIFEGRGLVYKKNKELIESIHKNNMLSLLGLFIFLLSASGAGIFIYYRRKRMEYEREILDAKAEAVYANQMKDRFLAGVSHEIRTPLNSVISFSESIINDSVDETAIRYGRIISRSGRSLLRIINDILDASKIAAGRFTVNNSPVNIEEIAGDVITILLPKSEKNKNSITLSVDPDMPRMLFSDPALLRQTLLNLAGNAVKFTHSGSVEIRIEDVRRKGNKVDFSITVEDTGIGMNEEELAKIYDMFYQVQNNSLEGSGLGLSIASHFTELLGGKLSVSSKPGKGSSFKVEYREIIIASEDSPGADPAFRPTKIDQYSVEEEAGRGAAVPEMDSLSSRTLNNLLSLPLADLLPKISAAIKYNDLDSANEILSEIEAAVSGSDSDYLKNVLSNLKGSLRSFDYPEAASSLTLLERQIKKILNK